MCVFFVFWGFFLLFLGTLVIHAYMMLLSVYENMEII